MATLPYSATPPKVQPAPVEFSPLLLGDGDHPAGYSPDAGLVDAVNVALLLRQPLLVTGEPGTGKSQLAYSVAYQLGLKPPLSFETKSTSVAKDLFYTFDNISRFRAAQISAEEKPLGAFMSFNALGAAIVLATAREKVGDLLPGDFVHSGQCRSVVLIDEIDKAPRDFPNDILNEVDRFFFRVPEAGGRIVSADEKYRPIVIMTSNSEKSLPDAFLRRCIFYSIPFPTPERLEQIVLTRLARQLEAGSPLVQEALAFFMRLRSLENELRKRPGTAELLNWLVAMIEFDCTPVNGVKAQSSLARGTLTALSKFTEDQVRIQDQFTSWVKG